MLESIGKLDKIEKNAYYARISLDTPFRPDDIMKKRLSGYLHDCIENPAAGMLTGYNELTGFGVNTPKYFFRNRHLVLKNEEVKTLFNEYVQKLNTLYPNTLNAREFLIKTKQVTLNSCKPINHNLRRAIFKLFGI